MSIEDILLIAVTNSVIVSVLLAIAGFAGRSIIEHRLKKDIEKYKMELQAAHNKEMEALKILLRKSQYEYEIQFAKVTDKKYEVIENLYKLLVRYSKGLNKLIYRWKEAKDQGKSLKEMTLSELYEGEYGIDSDKRDDFPGALLNAWSYFDENRIYLEEDLSKEILELLMTGYIAVFPAISAINFEQSKSSLPSELYKIFEELSQNDMLDKASETIDKYQEVLKDLEREFISAQKM